MTWKRTAIAALALAVVAALVPAARADAAGRTPAVWQATGQPFTQHLWRQSLLFAVALSIAVIVIVATAAALGGALLRRRRRRPPSRRAPS